MEPSVIKSWLSLHTGLKSDYLMITEVVRSNLKGGVDLTYSIKETEDGLELTIESGVKVIKQTTIKS